MSCKGIRGVCRRPHFLPLGKKKKRWIKIMIKSCEIITGIFWNTVLLPILSHCPTQPTLISISASFQTSPFYPRPLNPLLSHSFLFFCSLLSIPSFLSSFLPSFSSISPSPSLSLFPLFLSQNHTPLSVSFSISASVSLSFTPNTSLPSSLEDFDCVTVRFTWSFLKVL